SFIAVGLVRVQWIARMPQPGQQTEPRVGSPRSEIRYRIGWDMTTRASAHTKAQRHLARRDPVLKRLIASVGPCTLRYEPNRFASLARSIISQQISTKAALAIRTRLEATLDGQGLSAAGVLTLSDEAMREAGLSASKVKSFRDLAQHVHGGIVDLERIHELE